MNEHPSHFCVTLTNENLNLNQSIEVSPDEFILDVAKDSDLDLPYSCCAGSCFDCLGILAEGTVEQTAQALNFLKPKEIEAGYVLLCSAMPTSNCKILTHQAAELFGDD